MPGSPHERQTSLVERAEADGKWNVIALDQRGHGDSALGEPDACEDPDIPTASRFIRSLSR